MLRSKGHLQWIPAFLQSRVMRGLVESTSSLSRLAKRKGSFLKAGKLTLDVPALLTQNSEEAVSAGGEQGPGRCGLSEAVSTVVISVGKPRSGAPAGEPFLTRVNTRAWPCAAVQTTASGNLHRSAAPIFVQVIAAVGRIPFSVEKLSQKVNLRVGKAVYVAAQNLPFDDPEEVHFQSRSDGWTIAELDDGTVIRIKSEIIRILRSKEKKDSEGNPLYAVQSTPFLFIEHKRAVGTKE
ncbi:MAG: hypothetical protein AB7T14_06970 [Candidatus Methylacidiphilaceae bacterium]